MVCLMTLGPANPISAFGFWLSRRPAWRNRRRPGQIRQHADRRSPASLWRLSAEVLAICIGRDSLLHPGTFGACEDDHRFFFGGFFSLPGRSFAHHFAHAGHETARRRRQGNFGSMNMLFL